MRVMVQALRAVRVLIMWVVTVADLNPWAHMLRKSFSVKNVGIRKNITINNSLHGKEYTAALMKVSSRLFCCKRGMVALSPKERDVSRRYVTWGIYQCTMLALLAYVFTEIDTPFGASISP